MDRRQVLELIGSGLVAGACADKKATERSAKAPTEEEMTPAEGSAMPKRVLGRTGEEVSLIGLGGYHIGTQSDEAESIAIIRRAMDSGVTFLDNCWDYNGGQSEIRMGKALQGGYRQRAFLMTKVDGRSARAAAEQLEQSRKRLQTEVIDLVQIHEIIRPSDPERCFAPGGTLEALLAAQRERKIRYIGFTGHKDPAYHLAMIDAGIARGFTFDAVQMPLNVMDPHYKSFEKKVLPVLLEQGIGVLGMKALGSGDILESKVVTPVECLQYAMNLPTSVVITGCDSMEILEQALSTARRFKPLKPAQVEALLARTAPLAKKGEFEHFKTSTQYDGTVQNPHWLEEARL
jgi:predicted aldo/keto reductase-like oxidoreductase